ncbi:PilN domain-containing protein [Orbaceae bacterium ac157xtp]
MRQIYNSAMPLITFFINKETVSCFYAQPKVKKEQQNVIEKVYQQVNDSNDLTKLMQNFIDDIINNDKNKKRIACRIVLSDDLLLSQQIKIPNIKLSQNEIAEYLDASLTKLFKDNPNVVYDYREIESPDDKNKLLQVIACDAIKIAEYQRFLSNVKLQFIGKLLKKYDHLAKDKIATINSLTGFNLLPWRQKIKLLKRKYFLITFLLGCSLLFILITGLLITNKNKSINLNDINQEKTVFYQQILNKFSHINNLNKKNEKLKNAILHNQNIQQTFNQLGQFLAIFPQHLPEGSWITAFNISENEIVLHGNSFKHDAIWQFNTALSKLEQISSNQIETIKQNEYLLHFEITCNFKKNNGELL